MPLAHNGSFGSHLFLPRVLSEIRFKGKRWLLLNWKGSLLFMQAQSDADLLRARRLGWMQQWRHSAAAAAGVAFSGADSSALLLACHARWPGQVRAIHVHHGLQAAADGFQRHCEQLCARHGIALKVCAIDARNVQGQSPEDAARQGRYAALIQAAGSPGSMRAALDAVRSMALAQHADDQVETLLLALSRGAGVAGLAAMPGIGKERGWSGSGPCWQCRARRCATGCGSGI
jgi:tRNA(Ile)-lysidine synthase